MLCVLASRQNSGTVFLFVQLRAAGLPATGCCLNPKAFLFSLVLPACQRQVAACVLCVCVHFNDMLEDDHPDVSYSVHLHSHSMSCSISLQQLLGGNAGPFSEACEGAVACQKARLITQASQCGVMWYHVTSSRCCMREIRFLGQGSQKHERQEHGTCSSPQQLCPCNCNHHCKLCPEVS